VPLQTKTLAVDPDPRFAFQKAYRVRHAILRTNAQTQMNVIGHCMTFHDLHPLSLTQLSQNPPDLLSQTPVYRAPTILWHEHTMILAVLFHMRLALPISHGDLLPVWLIGRRPSTTPQDTPERQNLYESTPRGSGLPVVSYGRSYSKPPERRVRLKRC
jgi:hypothetical protein